ncbi:MAG: hypothetical protein E7306_09525 [Butyrivibrio sp.]|nr:hypothetical protein [Butyrivibrio sp.]
MACYVERPRTTCALGGAIAVINALPGVTLVNHTAIGCGGNLSGVITGGGGNMGDGTFSGSHMPSSAVGEREIVFGGAQRLTEEIKNALDVIDAELFVVATGCMTEMIGDDVEAAVRAVENPRKPVISISTPSFKGDAYYGYEIILDAIFNKFIPKSEKKDKKLVNIFGIVPGFDPFFRGDLNEIRRLLNRLGLKVNTFFTSDQTFEENILKASEASLNILLSPVWGTTIVKNFEETHGTPFFQTNLPIGAIQTTSFLKELSEHIEIDEKLLEEVIKSETDEYYADFIRATDTITNRQWYFYSATVTNSNYAIPVGKYLFEELGWHQEDTVVTDILKPVKKRALTKAFEAADFGSRLTLDTDTQRISRELIKRRPRNQGQRYWDAHTPFFLLGSSIDRATAAEIGGNVLPISFPLSSRLITTRAYAGYRGGLQLVEDIFSTLLA